ncbi:MAG TPA: GyrI-like domain-containing protein [Ktedonobacterales bacterium]|nr:GyrI-like domain-containing protein [Ktedonobacterales bacterium]
MIVHPPQIEARGEQHYVGIRSQASGRELNAVIPQLLGEVFAWAGQHGIVPAGAPFIRYHVINMATTMEIEVCLPVTSAVAGDGRVSPGVLPAGQYATLVYRGVANGVQANHVLLAWGNDQGLAWDAWEAKNGEVFRARYETFLTRPEEEPDQANWETEVAIRLADTPVRKD